MPEIIPTQTHEKKTEPIEAQKPDPLHNDFIKGFIIGASVGFIFTVSLVILIKIL